MRAVVQDPCTVQQAQRCGFARVEKGVHYRCLAPVRSPLRTDNFGRHSFSRRTLLLRAYQASTAHEVQSGTQRAPLGVASKPEGLILETPPVSWAGSGLYFWWQLGAVKYLAEHFDLSKVPVVGASGGALAAVLLACGIDPDKAFDKAYQLASEHEIWTKPRGLFGIWGELIKEWLRFLLPPDAADICRGRVQIVVTKLPSLKQKAIDDYHDNEDLIDVLMASVHIPFVLDWKPTHYCRGMHCVDGSLPDFFFNDNSSHLKGGGRAVIFDYFDDVQIPRSGRMDMLKLRTHEELHHIMDLGSDYAALLHRNGQLESYSARPVKRE